MALRNFNPTYTCTNVWTQQYACPLCAGQVTPLCVGRCNEVLIGCMSSLQQVIVQLNVLLDFARGKKLYCYIHYVYMYVVCTVVCVLD